MSFVSVCEESDFSPGDEVEVNQGPMDADLSQLDSFYNGHSGQLSGNFVIERSFVVYAGKTPVIAVVVGAVGLIGQLGYLQLQFGGINSSIIPHVDEDLEGRIELNYQPILIATQ